MARRAAGWMAAITVGVAMQAAPAAAADHERRVVVSIPDRMLALIESDQVIAVFGIHGTDDPRSIGFAKSHGCIRLRNEDVEVLFEQLRAGDVVELHDERTPEIQQLFAR